MRKDKAYEKTCSNCEFASILEDDSFCVCEKKGVVGSNFYCRKYVYDPLKRIPLVKPKFPKLEENDIL